MEEDQRVLLVQGKYMLPVQLLQENQVRELNLVLGDNVQFVQFQIYIPREDK